MRAFVAIPLSEDCADAIERLQSGLPFGRPVPRENLHLTLAFLGDPDPAVLAEIDSALAGLRAPAPQVAFSGPDVVEGRDRGLVVLNVAATDALAALQARVEAACRAAGADLPRRRFRPHVTLMRANRAPAGARAARLAEWLSAHALTPVPGFKPSRFVLYGSTLRRSGAVHRELASYPLTG